MKLQKYIVELKKIIKQIKHKASSDEGYISLLNEGPRMFPRGDNYKLAKI